MMELNTFKARGIILKETLVNNSDKVLTILLKDYGKFSVWAKNSKSLKSKFVSGTSIFNYCDFIIFDNGKNLSINQVDLIENFFNLTEDLDSLAYGTYFLEITDKIIQEATPVNDIMLLLLKSLLVLSKSKNIPVKLIGKIFEIKFLQLNGYTPIINNCSCCFKDIKNENEIYFGTMGAICKNCKSKENICIKVNNSIIDIFNYILSSDIDNLYKFNTSTELLNIICKINKIFINEHLYVKLNSKSFLDTIENI